MHSVGMTMIEGECDSMHNVGMTMIEGECKHAQCGDDDD